MASAFAAGFTSAFAATFATAQAGCAASMGARAAAALAVALATACAAAMQFSAGLHAPGIPPGLGRSRRGLLCAASSVNIPRIERQAFGEDFARGGGEQQGRRTANFHCVTKKLPAIG